MNRTQFLLAVLLSPSAFAADTRYATVRTSGQFDSDGTVLYSVYVATGPEKLTGVAVGGTVPVGVRFLESVDVPAGVVFEGVRDNVAVWSLAEIGADRLVGPFTFRGRPDGAGEVITEPAAAVSYREPEAGIAEYAGRETPLVKLESSGSVTFDQRGTLNEKGENAPVYLGKSGVLLFVAAGAVRTQTTVTVERQRIDEGNLPKTEELTWWCGLYTVDVVPAETPAKPFAFAFPTRRQVPLGLTGVVANLNEDISAKSASANRSIGLGFSNCTFPQFGLSTCTSGSGGPFGPGFHQFGFGVLSADRARASVTSAQLTAAFGASTSAVSSIIDGTSNTIAILTGKR
jgi:hypothetical protein